MCGKPLQFQLVKSLVALNAKPTTPSLDGEKETDGDLQIKSPSHSSQTIIDAMQCFLLINAPHIGLWLCFRLYTQKARCQWNQLRGDTAEVDVHRTCRIGARIGGISLHPIRTIVVVEACQRLPKNRSSIDDLGFGGLCGYLRRGCLSRWCIFQRSGRSHLASRPIALALENEAISSRMPYTFSWDTQ